jgi:putative iron-dependent peroxidase
VQRWAHDLKRFGEFPGPQRDAIIGRRRDTNEELKDAPESSHVKRTAQESYIPPAFMLRRSMPWAGANEQGLEFIAYVESLSRFDRMMRRMVGLEDGVVDGLFKFSRAVTGGYYWCPPIQAGRLDFSLLEI